jgi:F-type H+-transporting ATPase subunit c
MKNKLILGLITIMATVPAFAQEASSMAYGGAIAQGKIGASAVEGISRNPQSQKSMFVSMILGLVLIESLVIYALVIALQILAK